LFALHAASRRQAFLHDPDLPMWGMGLSQPETKPRGRLPISLKQIRASEYRHHSLGRRAEGLFRTEPEITPYDSRYFKAAFSLESFGRTSADTTRGTQDNVMPASLGVPQVGNAHADNRSDGLKPFSYSFAFRSYQGLIAAIGAWPHIFPFTSHKPLLSA
jgi:hypothetical protein